MKVKALTKRRIQMMAYEIAHELMNRGYEDTRIYYNNRAIDVIFNHKAWLKDMNDSPLSKFSKLKKIKDINPVDYFKYAAANHILSMSFEGMLYDQFYDYGCPQWLERIFKKYHVNYEIGDNWNLTCYPADEDMEVEYTVYYKQPETIYLRGKDNGIFQPIMDGWYKKSEETGDEGSSVIGAGMSFYYDGNKYFMTAQSPHQGSCSWEPHINWVEKELEKLGCTNIYYACGRMD